MLPPGGRNWQQINQKSGFKTGFLYPSTFSGGQRLA